MKRKQRHLDSMRAESDLLAKRIARLDAEVVDLALKARQALEARENGDRRSEPRP